MLSAKGRETLEVLQERLATFLAQHERLQGERAALAERLSSTLRAYEEALQQLRRYEQERVEMRVRLERILSWIDPGVPCRPRGARTRFDAGNRRPCLLDAVDDGRQEGRRRLGGGLRRDRAPVIRHCGNRRPRREESGCGLHGVRCRTAAPVTSPTTLHQ